MISVYILKCYTQKLKQLILEIIKYVLINNTNIFKEKFIFFNIT
jgi:hypothetical protein